MVGTAGNSDWLARTPTARRPLLDEVYTCVDGQKLERSERLFKMVCERDLEGIVAKQSATQSLT